jgi:hypothetical protein
MERRTIQVWIVSVLACLGLGFLADAAAGQDGTTFQGSQSSEGSQATTGTTTGSSSTSFTSGPSASGGTGASAGQLGSNRGSLAQGGSVRSGQPVAGAQVTGAVADNVRVQNQNSAIDPQAESGDATLTNVVAATFGPLATTLAGTAQVSQTGSNELDVSQTASAETGDAVAGAQVTGIVGDGEHVVQKMNSATCDGEELFCAVTGVGTASNEAEVLVGPAADSDDAAQAAQVGDNDAVLSQSATAASGDSLFGAQVTGIVGGSATVQNSNATSSGAEQLPAQSGDAEASNLAVLASGPSAVSVGSNAQSMQTGDNAADGSQDASVSTGDAVSGGQVTGAVGDSGSFFTVQNQQASEGDEAVSGDGLVANSLEASAGAVADGAVTASSSQNGDNDVTASQTATGATGDAVAGSQVTGAVGHEDVTVQLSNSAFGEPKSLTGNLSGIDLDADGTETINDADLEAGPAASADGAQTSQLGDNSVDATQIADLQTGDAVGGSQVTGLVTAGSTVVVQAQNATSDAGAESGDVVLETGNELDAGAGPEAEAFVTTGQAQQAGDDALLTDQSLRATTGDAVGGAQVTGVIAGDGSDVKVQMSNSSALAEPLLSGSVVADFGNFAALSAGPEAEGSDASSSQLGDDAVDAAQALEMSTGDALAGSQVTGVVTGEDSSVTVQNQNSSFIDTALTGDVDEAVNELIAEGIGPSAEAGAGVATASQTGDDALSVDQTVDASSGDAVAGSQVTGVVAGDGSDVTVMNSNSSFSAASESGAVTAANDFTTGDGGAIGPSAVADGNALASQMGDVALTFSQDAAASSGDALGGAQVTGVVGAETATISVQNSDDASEATSGDTDATNDAFGDAGPTATSFAGTANSQQSGEVAVAGDQALVTETGDTVVGSQVSGAVGGSTPLDLGAVRPLQAGRVT